MEQARRERASLTAGIERNALRAIARRLPPWLTSDQMTVLGVAGALGAGTAYALSSFDPHWLWAASALLVLNWLGDSLDGTLARVRGSERPRYGYYLDHAVDAFTTAAIGLGIGLSPFASVEAALVLVVLYLVMSINVYLESSVYGVFRMDYGVVGPTEVRILLILLNAVLVGLVEGAGVSTRAIMPYGTLIIAAMSAGMLGLLLWRFAGNLRRLARLEPLQRGEPRDPPPADSPHEAGVEVEEPAGIDR